MPNETVKQEEAISGVLKLIAVGKLSQGEEISEEKLCRKLETFCHIKILRGPASRAIQHFVTLGLMTRNGKAGTQVREFKDKNELSEIWRKRHSLELYVLQELAKQDRSDLTAIEKAQVAARQVIQTDPDETEIPTDDQRRAFIDADEHFHEALCDAAKHPEQKDDLRILREIAPRVFFGAPC